MVAVFVELSVWKPELNLKEGGTKTNRFVPASIFYDFILYKNVQRVVIPLSSGFTSNQAAL